MRELCLVCFLCYLCHRSIVLLLVMHSSRVFRLHNICLLSLRMRQLKNYVILFIAKSWRTNSEECVCISSKLHCYPCYSNSERWLVHSRKPNLNNKTFYLRGTPIIRAGIAVKDACKNLFFVRCSREVRWYRGLWTFWKVSEYVF